MLVNVFRRRFIICSENIRSLLISIERFIFRKKEWIHFSLSREIETKMSYLNHTIVCFVYTTRACYWNLSWNQVLTQTLKIGYYSSISIYTYTFRHKYVYVYMSTRANVSSVTFVGVSFQLRCLSVK